MWERALFTQISVVKLNPHLKFRNCVVLIVYNLVFHGAEVHRMLDNCWVTRSNGIRYRKRKESMWIFSGKMWMHNLLLKMASIMKILTQLWGNNYNITWWASLSIKALFSVMKNLWYSEKNQNQSWPLQLPYKVFQQLLTWGRFILYIGKTFKCF